jgi:hypothetical protein
MKKIISILITSFLIISIFTIKGFASGEPYQAPLIINSGTLSELSKTQKEKKEKEEISIFFKKKDKEKNRIFARGKKENFKEIDDIDKYTFSGKIIENWDNGDFNMYKVIWDKVETKDKEAEFDEIFTSKFGVAVKKGHKFEQDDKISANGYREDMIKAIKRLKSQESTNEKYNSKLSNKEQVNNNNKESSKSKDGGDSYGFLPTGSQSQSKNSDSQIGGGVPTFTTEEEIVTTSEGCSVIPNFDSEIAIVQKRQLQGTKEISGCSDSDETYPLNRNYEQCVDRIDEENKKVYKQYILEYRNDSLNGMIKVRDCAVDKDIESDIITEQFECGYDHDFSEGISIKKHKTIYKDKNNTERMIRDCFNINDSFVHYETFEGCDDIITNDGVVIAYKTFITDNNNGGDIILTDCIPKSNKMEIHDELCEIDPYIHDFDSQQSFANKQHFYYKNNQKISIGTCVQSDEALAHRLETSDCEVIYDDTAKRSSLGFKTFIENNIGKIYITECERPELQIISYTPTGEIWNKISTSGRVDLVDTTFSEVVFTLLADDDGTRRWDGSCLYYLDSSHYSAWQPRNNSCTSSGMQIVDKSIFHSSTICLDKYSLSWRTINGIVIDKNNSDQIPQFDSSYYFTEKYGGYSDDRADACCALSCSNGHCQNLTTLYKYPTYQRYDGTEYVNKSHILETKYVCGTGSQLDGVRQ